MTKFKHGAYNGCRFIGHFAGHDVWIAQESIGASPTLIARYGDSGGDYHSTSLTAMQNDLRTDRLIQGTCRSTGVEWKLPFREYLASEHACDFHLAWVMALAMDGVVKSHRIPGDFRHVD